MKQLRKLTIKQARYLRAISWIYQHNADHQCVDLLAFMYDTDDQQVLRDLIIHEMNKEVLAERTLAKKRKAK